MDNFGQFRSAVLELISLRRSRLEALALPDPDLVAALVDLETMYVELVNKTSPADQVAIGAFYRKALGMFGSKEERFQQYPDTAGLLLMLRIEGSRKRAMEMLRSVPPEIPK